MVEYSNTNDAEMQNGSDEDQGDWGEWGSDAEEDLDSMVWEQPALLKKASSKQEAKIFTTSKRTRYNFIPEEQILDKIELRISQLVDSLGISRDLAAAFLLKNQWNLQKA